MLSDLYSQKISDDWLWREKELRAVDRRFLGVIDEVDIKLGILITYAHWEGHFKFCASELLAFIIEGIKRKLFRWTDLKIDIRQRLLFCCYRKSNIAAMKHETFITFLNALSDERYVLALDAVSEIIMVDDNLNTMRAEAICRNLGVDYDWFITKKIVIDERMLEHRNALAHGSSRLRSGDLIILEPNLFTETLSDVRNLIRETRNRFENAINLRSFLTDSAT